MFNSAIQKVRENIIPFICVGLFIGVFIGKASWFNSFGLVRTLLAKAGVKTSYADSGQTLFFSYFDAQLLTYFLILVFAFSGCIRIVVGRQETEINLRGLIDTIGNLGGLLAFAWMGLIIGISVPVLIFESFSEFAAFFLMIIYPLLFLVEMILSIKLLYGINALSHFRFKLDRRFAGNVGTRAEGLVSLAIGLAIFAYQDVYFEFIKSVSRSILSVIQESVEL